MRFTLLFPLNTLTNYWQLEINDGTFPALLKTLSDGSDAVVRQDLILLCQMFRNTDDAKFSSFMVNLLKLFGTDRRLLETRGNLIIRQLCLSLSAERIYRTLADALERDEVGCRTLCFLVPYANRIGR
jgi:vacuole morphology and inheritance protein 14